MSFSSLNKSNVSTLSHPSQALPEQQVPFRIRRRFRRSEGLLLDLPIAGRLTLGFLLAALIAALVAGIIGFQHTQSLGRQSAFYENLLQTNTSLNTGENFLQLMNVATHTTLDAATAPIPSQETLITDQNAVEGLATRYNDVLSLYLSHDLLEQHPDQVALLSEIGATVRVTQQRTLASSSLRTWRVYEAAQKQVIADIMVKDVLNAQKLERFQVEPTNADAQSALRSLIQFNQHLSSSIRQAAVVEQQTQLYTTIIGVVLAIIGIALVGIFISGTLVRRLNQLRAVTQAVEDGLLEARAVVIGRDEIADVSASINAMLEAIVGLLQETRSQHDALTNAAGHLFSNMRIVSAGDLRVNATVSSDPIGMLANAFNFTVGRFRRFVLHTQSAVEELESIANNQLARSNRFAQAVRAYVPSETNMTSSSAREAIRSDGADKQKAPLLKQVRQMRDHLQQMQTTGMTLRDESLTNSLERLLPSIRRLAELSNAAREPRSMEATRGIIEMQMQEVHLLETFLTELTTALQQIQEKNTTDLAALEQNLGQLSTAIRQLPTTPQGRTPSQPLIATSQPLQMEQGYEQRQELIRMSEIFTQETTILARHILGITRELRGNIVSFQLNTAEGNGEVRPFPVNNR